MAIVIITPLFPPDPSDAAAYTKLLATKLQPTTLIVFGSIPEAVEGVQILNVSKRTSRFLRILTAFRRLEDLKPKTLIVQNGPLAELPALLFSLFNDCHLVYVISDYSSKQTSGGMFVRYLQRKMRTKAKKVITLPTNSAKYLPPEWLPQTEPSDADYDAHQKWWQKHLLEYTTS